MRAAIRQAWANKWFASESYVLTPRLCGSKEIIKGLGDLGLGLYSIHGGKLEQIQAARRVQLPHSYASWVFNEWVGRQIQFDKVHQDVASIR